MKIYSVLSVLLLTACASGGTPKQTVFEIETGYKDALQVAATYDSLPSCTLKTTVICSDTAVAKKIKAAKDVAQAAIDNAEAAVRDPMFDASQVSALVTAAKYAEEALVAITTLQAIQTATKGVKK